MIVQVPQYYKYCGAITAEQHSAPGCGSKKNQTAFAMAGRQDVGQLVSRFESGPEPLEQQKVPAKGGRGRCTGLLRKFLRSRFMGLVFGPAYGLFVYLYITHLILAGAPFTKEGTTENQTIQVDQTRIPEQINPSNKVPVVGYPGSILEEVMQELADLGTVPMVNLEEPDFVPLMTTATSHLIGGATGTGVGLGLTVSSIFSVRVRCSLALMVPSLVAKRGRGFMLTFAMSLLIKGPVNTIQFNLQELVRCFTCMYEEIKGLAERFQNTFKGLMDKVSALLREIETLQKQMTRILKERLDEATEEQRQEIERAKREMKEQAKEVEKAVKEVKDVVNAPGNILNTACDAVTTGVSAVANGFEDLGSTIADGSEDFGSAVEGFGSAVADFFSWRRRKRSACGIPDIIDIPSISEPNLGVSEKLKAILETLKPDLDLLDIDLKGMQGEIDASSIKQIRENMKALFNNLMNLCKLIARYWSKIFYLTVIAVVLDALRYQNQYYTDNDFDNKMVDENLKKMWKRDGLKKLTPLRKWEVKKQEAQKATSLKMTKEELQKLATQSFPVILATVVFLGIVIVDFAFTTTLQAFEKNAKFGISFPGMEQGISFGSFMDGTDVDAVLKVHAFNLSTDPCLPRSRQTGASSLGPIFAVLFLCLLSCLIDAYFSRVRAQICNLFYPFRADERAKYLFKYLFLKPFAVITQFCRRIELGRKSRFYQLNLILSRELDKRRRAKEFALFSWLSSEVGKGTKYIKCVQTC